MKKLFIPLMTASLLLGSYPTQAFDSTKFWEHKGKISLIAVGVAAVIASLAYLTKPSKGWIRCTFPIEHPIATRAEAPNTQVKYTGKFHNIQIVGEERTAINVKSVFHGKSKQEVDHKYAQHQPRYKYELVKHRIAPNSRQVFYIDSTSECVKPYDFSHIVRVPTYATIDLIQTEISGEVRVNNLRRDQIITDPDKNHHIKFFN